MGQKLNNWITATVPYERRRPGAVGWRSPLIDHDDRKSLLQSTDLDRPSFAIESGLEPVNRIRASIGRLPT